MARILIIIVLIVVLLYLSHNYNKKTKIALLVGYLLCVMSVTLGGRTVGSFGQLNLIPLKQILYWTKRNYYAFGLPGVRWTLYGVIENILMFVPLGILVPVIKDMSLKKVLFLGFLFSLSIELIQLLTGLGMFETDDLITNTLGTYIGYRCAKGIK